MFMTCSPTDLGDQNILSFEKEEETILTKAEKYPISLTIVDSGSLEGLENALYEADGYDIVHITGHA